MLVFVVKMVFVFENIWGSQNKKKTQVQNETIVFYMEFFLFV